MPSLQSNFRTFHQAIKLGRFEEEATLREKRDRVLGRLRSNGLSFDWFNQGSYEVGTGIVPVAGDYDIDVGLVLPGSISDDPVAVKERVFVAVQPHTTRVEFRKPCLTVYYQSAGESIYHVDLPVYVKDAYGQMHLAVGKEHAKPEHRQWVHSEPKQLSAAILNRWSGEDGAQFRRVIQYLKRWRDENFPPVGKAAPPGVGLTVAAYNGFQPSKNWTGISAQYDDLMATRGLVSWMLSSFQNIWGLPCSPRRLVLRLPVQPANDVLAGMCDQHMIEFEQRLVQLRDAMDLAARTESSLGLKRIFGSAFPG